MTLFTSVLNTRSDKNSSSSGTYLNCFHKFSEVEAANSHANFLVYDAGTYAKKNQPDNRSNKPKRLPMILVAYHCSLLF